MQCGRAIPAHAHAACNSPSAQARAAEDRCAHRAAERAFRGWRKGGFSLSGSKPSAAYAGFHDSASNDCSTRIRPPFELLQPGERSWSQIKFRAARWLSEKVKEQKQKGQPHRKDSTATTQRNPILSLRLSEVFLSRYEASRLVESQ
jgi:hypothetical protein